MCEGLDVMTITFLCRTSEASSSSFSLKGNLYYDQNKKLPAAEGDAFFTTPLELQAKKKKTTRMNVRKKRKNLEEEPIKQNIQHETTDSREICLCLYL